MLVFVNLECGSSFTIHTSVATEVSSLRAQLCKTATPRGRLQQHLFYVRRGLVDYKLGLMLYTSNVTITRYVSSRHRKREAQVHPFCCGRSAEEAQGEWIRTLSCRLCDSETWRLAFQDFSDTVGGDQESVGGERGGGQDFAIFDHWLRADEGALGVGVARGGRLGGHSLGVCWELF
jgi:hypothetical protein